MNVSRWLPTGSMLSGQMSGKLRRVSKLLDDRSRLLETLNLAPDKAALRMLPFFRTSIRDTLNRRIDVEACKDIAFVQR